MNDFYINQKIVCVYKGWNDPSWRRVGTCPVENGVYTIRQLGIEYYRKDDSIGTEAWPGVLLNEIHNGPVDFLNNPLGNHEFMFPVCAFRPLVERKTDISIFTKMLTPDKEKV